MNKPVTCWYLRNKQGDFEYNHLEWGHCTTDTPTSHDKIHNGWKNMVWKKELCYLDENNKVVLFGVV